MNVAVIAGTRPEIIRVAVLIKELQKTKIDFSFILTGQHYDFNMCGIFIKELGLPEPDFKLEYKGQTHAEHMAAMMPFLEKVFSENLYDVVFDQGDTNSTLSAALAAVKIHIPVAHIEAGNRCYDLNRPEEVNRTIVDHISSLLFAQSEDTKQNLLKEGLPESRIHVTGNTVIDSCYEFREAAKSSASIFKKINTKNYILVTLHRAETVDHKDKLEEFVKTIAKMADTCDVVFPIHPRTVKMLEKFGLQKTLDKKSIHIIEPVGYFDFLVFLDNATLLLTDSGGALKEATAYKIPTIIYADKWADTEGKDIFWKLSGYSGKSILDLSAKMMLPEFKKSLESLQSPFGDGSSSKRMIEITKKYCEAGKLKVPEAKT